MLKKLLSLLFEKLEDEKDNDSKSKSGNANFFVNEVLEVRFRKPNYISSKSIIGYYDKYVIEKENNTGAPSTELKNYISQYLGFENFQDFEIKNTIELREPKKRNGLQTSGKLKTLLIVSSMAFIGGISYTAIQQKECLEWKVDHYEKVDCLNELPNPLLTDVAVDIFKKVPVNCTTIFFKYGKPTIWYGKSSTGKMEYFNSRGLHPETMKELKPITKYIIHKYVCD